MANPLFSQVFGAYISDKALLAAFGEAQTERGEVSKSR